MLNEQAYDLEVSTASTLREFRYQLAQKGGPWGDDHAWLYGGTLLENNKTMVDYAINNRDTVDIVLRMYTKLQIFHTSNTIGTIHHASPTILYN